MYPVGSYILYGKHGVCHVDEVDFPPNHEKTDASRLYYKLSPVFADGNETIFVPVDSSVHIREAIDSDAASQYMQSIPTLEPEVFYSSQPAKLNEHYQKLTDSYDPGVYLSLMKEVYIKRLRANRLHKKLSNIDQRYLAFAEKIVCTEFAVALHTSPETIREQINTSMQAG